MYQRSSMQYLSTSGASITALTGAGYVGSIMAYCSAASGTLTVVDSANAGALVVSFSGTAAAVLSYTPCLPLAVKSLSATASGAIFYTISYATQ